MSYSCECGAQHGFVFADGRDECRFCGRVRDLVRQPLMVVLGGAATGKSSICRVWERDPRVFALDLDAVGRDPFVVTKVNRDFVGLWGFNLRLALEMQLNGFAPLLCGFCYPDQVLANPESNQFSGVHFLALVCDDDEAEARVMNRAGGEAAAAAWPRALSRELDQFLRHQSSDQFTVLDTSGTSLEETIASAGHWIESRLPRRP